MKDTEFQKAAPACNADREGTGTGLETKSRSGEKIDLRKLVIYSEIMTPKFKE